MSFQILIVYIKKVVFPFVVSIYNIGVLNCCFLGITKIGTRHAAEHQDIIIEGTGVGDHHCYIENINGVITLHPIAAMCAIDGKMVIQPTRLAQGKLVV